jgi:hypothetical protein
MKGMAALVAIVWIVSVAAPVAASDAARGWKEYFPLATGSSWSYGMTDRRSGKTQHFTAEVKGRQFVKEIGRHLVIVDETQLGEHLPVGYFEDGDGYLIRFVYLEYAGNEVISPGTQSTGHKILPPDPAQLSNWQSDELLLGIRHLWRYDLSRGVVVEVPAGSFRHCILVEASGTSRNAGVEDAMRPFGRYRFRDWYAPGVGLVRSESVNDRDPETPEIVSELLEYRVR